MATPEASADALLQAAMQTKAVGADLPEAPASSQPMGWWTLLSTYWYVGLIIVLLICGGVAAYLWYSGRSSTEAELAAHFAAGSAASDALAKASVPQTGGNSAAGPAGDDALRAQYDRGVKEGSKTLQRQMDVKQAKLTKTMADLEAVTEQGNQLAAENDQLRAMLQQAQAYSDQREGYEAEEGVAAQPPEHGHAAEQEGLPPQEGQQPPAPVPARPPAETEQDVRDDGAGGALGPPASVSFAHPPDDVEEEGLDFGVGL